MEQVRPVLVAAHPRFVDRIEGVAGDVGAPVYDLDVIACLRQLARMGRAREAGADDEIPAIIPLDLRGTMLSDGNSWA